jgi:D-sedoheptulose 7-phosphate isomerase
MNSTEQNNAPVATRIIEEAAEAVLSLKTILPNINAAVEMFLATLSSEGKVLTAGNGGSAAEAMHLAEELSGRYCKDRRALPGLSLASDGTVLTCISNDYGFDNVFARQVEALGSEGDLLVLFSSSGNSPNLIAAAKRAKSLGMRVIAFLGRGGGAMRNSADIDLEVTVPDAAGAHVQEAHQVLIHLILEQVDYVFACQ